MKTIKKSLIEKHGYKCQICNLSSWLDKPISLELDHIDGNHFNDEESNIRLLCPNCHSQTDTFRGRNINTGKHIVSDDDLLSALQASKNIRQALIKVGLTPKGLNYKRAANLLNVAYSKSIDTTNSQFNTVWINNASINKKIKKDCLEEYLGNGWMLGRITVSKPPISKGKMWVTNGVKSKFVFPNEVPEGWWKGRVI
jgi:hypothetical protein